MAQADWTPEAVLVAIRARYEAIPRQTLAWLLVRKSDPELVRAAEEYFGKWHRAITAAGLPLAATFTDHIE